MKGNIGFIFATNCSLDDIRECLKKHRRDSAAKTGQLSMVDLSLPSGPTGMDPSQTSFFQALNIGTKIVKGQIELISDFPLLKIGDKVAPSAAILLGKLSIKPFEYGMEVEQVYQDATVFDAAVLDISDNVPGRACLMCLSGAGFARCVCHLQYLAYEPCMDVSY